MSPITYNVSGLSHRRSQHSPSGRCKFHFSNVAGVLLARQGLGEDVGCLFGVATAIDGDGPLLHELADPVPADSDMFGAFVE